MKIGFIGLGNLGMPMALAFSLKGHDVIGYDLNPDRMNINLFKEKEVGPAYEPSIKPFLQKSNMQFVKSMDEVLKKSEIVFVTVQTPNEMGYGDGTRPLSKKRQNYNLVPLTNCLNSILRKETNAVIVIVSTVLPGTIKELFVENFNIAGIKLVHNPMFCAMGTVLPDLYNPEFILLGGEDKEAVNKVGLFYHTINNSFIFKTNFENAEMIKTCYNGFVTMKINYANTLMEMAHKLPGCDVDEVVDCLSLASTAYLRGGMGDGGGCHPKENSSLSWLAQKLNLSFDWFEMNMMCRQKQTKWLASIIEKAIYNYGKKVILLGLAFKPETNLVDGSPALLLKYMLEKHGHKIEAYDPLIDDKMPDLDNKICFISTKHKAFQGINFPDSSIVIDPWRYIAKTCGAGEVIQIGKD